MKQEKEFEKIIPMRKSNFDRLLKQREQETKNKILKIIYEAEWWRLGKKEFENLIQKIKEV